ncbi:hypothetical protein [Devosia nitrariae]|uniref:Uncharacterized protein n=1 Tax=Devosia nitrariae TaxID=2071872 RepID=A0ABQ5W0D8_9HYPH|nr:hypothetical protein [Devosia nitrariae]GLQ53529.1 hypothetical protein GCM10010862_07880 [Devosia nitrariae]
MTIKEDDFKTGLAAVVDDLHKAGTKDAEAMLLLGRLASDLSGQIKASNWSQAKKRMSRADYNTLLESFREGGNTHVQEGRIKQAYAVQALAMSLIAPTYTSPEIKQGGQLLDELIDRTIVFYRRSRKKGV